MLTDLHGILRRLKAIDAELHNLHTRLDTLESQRTARTTPPIPAEYLPQLPDTLRSTLMAITQLKEAPAEVVATQTHRTRGMESIYLNQLVRMGYLQKIKKGKRIYFQTLQSV